MKNTPKDKVVYFVRHGQSVDNVTPVFQSAASPLSKIGHKQAKTIAHRASNLSFEALITSTYTRARETASYIEKATGKKAELSDLFIERKKPSSVDGKPHSDAKAKDLWRKSNESLFTPGLRVDDAENFDDILERADKALEFLDSRQEESILVVTHGYFLRAIVARVILGDSFSPEALKNFQSVASMENTGLTVLRYQAAPEEEHCWRLWIYNDHAHLAE